MSFWSFNPASRRYRITPEGAAATGQRPGTFIGQARMLRFREDMITTGKERTNALASQVATGNITLNQWVLGMRQEVKNNFINQYMLAHGGRNTMTPADWGRVGQMTREQYRFLDSFAADIASGKYTEVAVAARARMYVEASSQAFERAKALQRGVPDLPQYPGDGATPCLCITTPNSRVLTHRGWIAIAKVQIGDYVLTHRLRWRKVTDVIVKPSQPYHRGVYLHAPGYGLVGATDNHKWYTDKGWLDSNDIDNSLSMVYNYSCNVNPDSGETHHAKDLSAMRRTFIEPEQANQMQSLPVSVRVREHEGFSSGTMSVLRNEREGSSAMGGQGITTETTFCGSQGTKQAEADICRSVVGHPLATEASRWSALGMVLGRRPATNDLSVSMGLDTSQWPDSAWASYPPLERGYDGRPSGELGIIAEHPALTVAWWSRASTLAGKDAGTNLRTVRANVQEATSQGQITEILFGGMLSPGTTIYDLTVEEDHSFVIEGLFAHNSNCKCSWRIDEDEQNFLCYWQLSSAEHCEGCLTNAAQWNPLIVPKAFAATRSAVVEHLEALHV